MNAHKTGKLLFALSGMLILTSACSASPSGPTGTPAPNPSATAVPTSTAIPGFEGWSVVNPQAVDVRVEDGSLVMTLKQHALWFMEQRGVLVYRPVTGNFRITADVLTAKSSDPSVPPGDGSSIQLGGLMARDGSGGQEDYVFIVVGEDTDGLSVETKSTREGLSKWNGPGWDSGQAELRLCRFNETFNLYKRHIGLNEDWNLAEAYQRPDLPETLQVGLNLYTDGTPDLRVRYENLRIEPVSGQAECAAN
jgi:hypothetical protein